MLYIATYRMLGNKVKEDLIVQEYTGQNTFTFELKLNGLKPIVENGIIYLADNQGNKEWFLEKPYMKDADNKYSNKVSLNLREENGKTFIDVIADQAFLTDSQTKFPVTVDPTIVKNDIQRDTYIASGFPYDSFNSDLYMYTGYNPYYGTQRSLIDFYLPALPSGSKIGNATFSAFEESDDGATYPVDLYRINTLWDGNVSWSNKPSIGSTSESTARNFPAYSYWNWDITQLTKDWYSGAQKNYGVMLVQQNENSSPERVFSTANNTSNRPKLTINYTVDPIGLENFWGLTKDGVNPANGNLVSQATDFSAPGRGIPVSLEHTYNSRASMTPGLFGYGWTSNWEAKIIHSGSGPVTFIDQDGTPHYFGELAAGKYAAHPGIYLDLVKNADGTFTITQTDGTKVNFNAAGKLSSIVDTNGNSTGFTYNASGQLSSITDASGRITNITYHANGFISSVKDSANRTISYGYDANGNLTQVTDAKQNATSYAYDALHHLTGITNARSITTTFAYESERVAGITRPLTIDGTQINRTTSYSYDTVNLVTQVTDGEGKRIDYTYNANGNVVQITENPLDPANKSVTTFAYDNNNNLTEIKDPNTNKANGSSAYVYTYDAKGNITGVKLPENQQAYNTFDSQNNLTKEQDYNGNISAHDYDSNRNRTDSTDPNAQTTANRYYPNGNIEYSTAAIAAAENLVLNSGFERDTDANNWPDQWFTELKPNTTATYTWSDVAKYGKKSLAISNPTGWAIATSDLLPFSAGQKYIISAYVKTENTQGTAVVKVAFYDQYGKFIDQKMAYELKGTHDWTRVQAVVDSAPAGTTQMKASVGLNAGTGTAYFDAVQLEKGTTLSSYNLVDNAGFEVDTNADKIPDFWTTSGNLAYADGMDQNINSGDDKVYVGKYSFKLTGEANVDKSIKQRINISGDANTRLTLSGWSKQQGASPSGGWYSLQVAINYTDGSVDWTNANQFDPSAGGWQHVAAKVAPTKSFSSIDVYYYFYNQTGTAWFDAMRLEMGGAHTLYGYDAKGNYLEKLTDPTDTVTTFTHDAAGNRTGIQDGKGFGTGFEYDANNNLIQVNDAKLGATSYGYDGAGNRTSVTDAKNNLTSYGYNELNQVSSITNALNQTIQLGYDKNGNTTKIVFPKGNTLSYSYNALNRLDGISYDGAKQWDLAYDANGNLTSATDSAGKATSFSYDKNNRLTQVADGLTAMSYSYDNNSNVSSINASAGAAGFSQEFGYNPLNLLTALSRNGVNQAKFIYDEQGHVISAEYANGTYSALEYDDLGRLKKLTNYANAGAVLDSYTYAFDQNSNITSITTAGGTINYQYDELNRLTQETLLDGTVIDYEYDAVGNRTKKTVTQGTNSTTTTYSYDAGNQLTAVNGQAFTYDANGNLLDNGAKTFVYNAENRLIEVKDAAGARIASFTYDHVGKRISKTTASGTVYFHYDGNNVIFETDENNNIVAEYTWNAQGQPVTMTENGVTYYYHVNGHGDVVKLTDASGNIVAEYLYDAWGNILSQSGAMAGDNPYRYASYRFDEETGLYYLMARYYDADTGRFLTRDTFRGIEKDPQSLNQYAYSRNNPVKYIDPSGHFIQIVALAELALVAVALGISIWAAIKYFGTKGSPGNNQAQNRQIDAIANKHKLNRAQRERLHRIISKGNFSYREIDEIAEEIKAGRW